MGSTARCSQSDLHANVWVDANERARLALKRPWRDGTTHLLFEPLELLEKLAALTPRPEINLLLCHGVLAPQGRWRPEVVAYRRADERTGAVEPS